MMLDTITFCISAFERPALCRGTIDRIQRLYPGVRIVVADDSSEWRTYPGATTIPCAYDSGLAAKRNWLAENAETEYLMMLDDDMLIQKGSIEKLWDALQSGYAVAGMAKYDKTKKKWMNSESRLSISGGTLAMKRPHKVSDDLYLCNFVPNCFMAKRSAMLRVRYSEKYKICGEHMDFFLRLMATGERCAFVPGIHFVDVGSRPDNYKPMRRRGKQYRRQMMRDWGITKIKKWAKPGKRVVYE